MEKEEEEEEGEMGTKEEEEEEEEDDSRSSVRDLGAREEVEEMNWTEEDRRLTGMMTVTMAAGITNLCRAHECFS